MIIPSPALAHRPLLTTRRTPLGTWIPSGFTLSADDADLWVVINNDCMRVFTIESLKQLITEKRSELKITRTRAGINHNRPGQHSKAYLIPFETLDNYVSEKILSPIRRR